MDNKAKVMAVSVIFGVAALTGCTGSAHLTKLDGQVAKMMEHLGTLDGQVASAQSTADEALRMAKAADHIAFQANQAAMTADELARMAIACCDANSHRLNTMFHNAQQK